MRALSREKSTTAPNSQGGTVCHGDPDDGKYKTGLDSIVDYLDAPACPGCAKYARTIAEVRRVLRELLKKLE